MIKKRFEYGFDAIMCTRSIYDTKSGVEYEECELRDIVDILNRQDQRIAELEEQLKNAIVPKFKIGQEIWCVYEYWWNGQIKGEPNKFAINNYYIDEIRTSLNGSCYLFMSNFDIIYQPKFNVYGRFVEMEGMVCHHIKDYYLFATKEEAQAKLKELQGE